MLPKNYECEGQMSLFDLDSWYGKTYTELSVQTTEKTSEPSLKRPQKSRITMPLFLDLRKGNGPLADVSWEMDIRWLGEDMTLNTGECPNEGKEYVYSLISTDGQHRRYFLNCGQKPMTERPSKLSQILETNPDPKYNLSAKACQGILNRAEKRGKKLPEQLETALRKQSASRNVPEDLGGGKGILIQNEKTGALSTLNNQSVAYDKCLNPWDVQSKHIQSSDGVAEPLYSGECRYGGGESYVLEEKKPVVYGISGYDSNSMKSSNPHSGIYEAETSRTLDGNGGSPACNQGGMAVVCIEGNGSRDSHKGDGFKESDTMYTLNTVEQHAVCIGVDAYNQAATGDISKTLNSVKTDSDHVPCVAYGLDRASFNQGQNAKFGFSIEKELSPALVAKGPGGVLTEQ